MLADIFEHTLQDVYYAENAITKALPKVAEAAKDAKLKQAAEDHLQETKGQIKKLGQVFKSIGKQASGEKCDAIRVSSKRKRREQLSTPACWLPARRSSTTRFPGTVPCGMGKGSRA
ncbi:hypothetical protein MPLSOD_280078 [Mesorhizobium sp. SOD10]|nr:hypothetical protein MPLSOD_280078 [Mesorhizobium sp. SOD10]